MNTVETLIFLLGVAIFTKLVFLRAVNFYKDSNFSQFELERRLKHNDEVAQKALSRQQALQDLLSFRLLLNSILIVLLVLCFSYSLGLVLGTLISIIALLGVSVCARLSIFQRTAQQLYDTYESRVIRIVTAIHSGLRVIPEISYHSPQESRPHSREELLHIIEGSKTILSEEERHLLVHAATFKDKYVHEIMTPRSVVETINAKEVLGPIVLDRLHKTGHSRFPVITDDFNRVVGLLYVHDLLARAQHNKKLTAEKAMEPNVFYINENQSLASALTGFLRVKHHLFIVVNEFEEVTGIVTIEDVVEALIGRKIVDEFDQYDDLRAVAMRAASAHHKSDHKPHIA